MSTRFQFESNEAEVAQAPLLPDLAVIGGPERSAPQGVIGTEGRHDLQLGNRKAMRPPGSVLEPGTVCPPVLDLLHGHVARAVPLPDHAQ